MNQLSEFLRLCISLAYCKLAYLQYYHLNKWSLSSDKYSYHAMYIFYVFIFYSLIYLYEVVSTWHSLLSYIIKESFQKFHNVSKSVHPPFLPVKIDQLSYLFI